VSCALKQVLDRRLESPEYQPLLEELLKRYKDDPQYFFYLKASLELSVPKELGFNERVVRMTCDTCALNPLEECELVEVLIMVLQEHSMNRRNK